MSTPGEAAMAVERSYAEELEEVERRALGLTPPREPASRERIIAEPDGTTRVDTGWGLPGAGRPPLQGEVIHFPAVADTTNPKDRIGRGKVQLALIPSSGEIYCALAFQDGAAKYGPYNWRSKKVSAMVYINAMRRHLLALLDGEWLTDDTRVPHLGAIMASAAILADAFETGNLVDDRPRAGPGPRLLQEWARKPLEDGAAEGR